MPGRLTPPAGYFACGRWFCSSAAEYCYEESFTLHHSCEPLPPCAPPPDCSCLAEVGCLCTQAEDGSLSVLCSGA